MSSRKGQKSGQAIGQATSQRPSQGPAQSINAWLAQYSTHQELWRQINRVYTGRYGQRGRIDLQRLGMPDLSYAIPFEIQDRFDRAAREFGALYFSNDGLFLAAAQFDQVERKQLGVYTWTHLQPKESLVEYAGVIKSMNDLYAELGAYPEIVLRKERYLFSVPLAAEVQAELERMGYQDVARYGEAKGQARASSKPSSQTGNNAVGTYVIDPTDINGRLYDVHYNHNIAPYFNEPSYGQVSNCTVAWMFCHEALYAGEIESRALGKATSSSTTTQTGGQGMVKPTRTSRRRREQKEQQQNEEEELETESESEEQLEERFRNEDLERLGVSGNNSALLRQAPVQARPGQCFSCFAMPPATKFSEKFPQTLLRVETCRPIEPFTELLILYEETPAVNGIGQYEWRDYLVGSSGCSGSIGHNTSSPDPQHQISPGRRTSPVHARPYGSTTTTTTSNMRMSTSPPWTATHAALSPVPSAHHQPLYSGNVHMTSPLGWPETPAVVPSLWPGMNSGTNSSQMMKQRLEQSIQQELFNIQSKMQSPEFQRYRARFILPVKHTLGTGQTVWSWPDLQLVDNPKWKERLNRLMLERHQPKTIMTSGTGAKTMTINTSIVPFLLTAANNLDPGHRLPIWAVPMSSEAFCLRLRAIDQANATLWSEVNSEVSAATTSSASSESSTQLDTYVSPARYLLATQSGFLDGNPQVQTWNHTGGLGSFIWVWIDRYKRPSNLPKRFTDPEEAKRVNMRLDVSGHYVCLRSIRPGEVLCIAE